MIVAETSSASADELLALSDQLMQQHPPAAVVLGAREDGRVHLVVNLDRSLEERGLDAVKVVREAAALMGGGGGGRPTMARAGGREPEKLPAVAGRGRARCSSRRSPEAAPRSARAPGRRSRRSPLASASAQAPQNLEHADRRSPEPGRRLLRRRLGARGDRVPRRRGASASHCPAHGVRAISVDEPGPAPGRLAASRASRAPRARTSGSAPSRRPTFTGDLAAVGIQRCGAPSARFARPRALRRDRAGRARASSAA